MTGRLGRVLFWIFVMWVVLAVTTQFLIPVVLPFIRPVAWVALIGGILIISIWACYEARLLSEEMMTLLDKLTNRSQLMATMKEMRANSRRIDPDELARKLNERVIGQPVVVDQVSRKIALRLAQKRRNRPVFTCLMSGPTGVGKTELAKALSKELFNKPVFRIECGQLDERHGMSTLIGSPKGYHGSDTHGTLPKHLKEQPESVILFDELEKAASRPDAPLNKLLLSLLDEGRVQEQSDGSLHDATGAVIIMTSNAAHKELGELAQRFADDPEQLARVTKDALQKFFAPEMLGRIDLVTTMAPLSDESRAEICALHLVELASQYGFKVHQFDHVSPEVFATAVMRSEILAAYGARELIRWLEDQTGDGFMQAQEQGWDRIRLELVGEDVRVLEAR